MRPTNYLLLYELEMMKCFLLTHHLMFLLDSVSGSLPAPVNVSLISVDFRHVLRWDPGPGAPPGTQYKIFKRPNSGKEEQLYSSETSLKLELDKYILYFFNVQASYNQTLSPESRTVSFTPFVDTKISAATLSLAGCGDCIKINVTLDKTVQETYNLDQFKVLWRKANGSPKDNQQFQMPFQSHTLKNLERGQQYCVQVYFEISVNKNTEPSAWSCTFTSIVEPRNVNVILGGVAVLGILTIGALMSFIFCLHYTGFLCKLKALPRALTTTLITGKILTLDMTIPDLISVCSETDRQNKCKNPTVPHPAARAISSGEAEEEEEEEEDDDDDDEEKKVYMYRNTGLSSSEGSRQDSRDVSGNSTLPASVRSPEEADAEFDHEELEQFEAKDEGAEVSFVPEGGQTEVQGHVTGGEEEEEEDMKEKEGACHRNVNLFSVTLSALPVSEEEEEDDFLKLSDLDPLVSTHSKRTLSHTDSQTDSDDQTPVALMQLTPEDVNESGYECRRANTLSGCL